MITLPDFLNLLNQFTDSHHWDVTGEFKIEEATYSGLQDEFYDFAHYLKQQASNDSFQEEKSGSTPESMSWRSLKKFFEGLISSPWQKHIHPSILVEVFYSFKEQNTQRVKWVAIEQEIKKYAQYLKFFQKKRPEKLERKEITAENVGMWKKLWAENEQAARDIF